MKRTVFVLVIFGVLHFSPRPCTARGSTNNSRASPWHSSHSATHDEESQKTSSHPNDQKTTVPLSQHDQSEGVTVARQKVKDTEHAGPVLSPVKDIQREEQALDLRLKNDDNETPPIRSYPTNGRTKPKKTMAAVNEADGRSKSKKAMAFWNEADSRSKPKKTMAFWNEADGRSKPKKPMAFWDQTEGRLKGKTQDESGTVSRRPLKGSIKEAPGHSSIKEDPGNGFNKEALEKVFIKETPGIGSIKETSRKGFIKEAAEKGSNKEALEKGSIKEALEKGSIKESREKGSIKEAPGKGSIKEEPGKGSIKEALGKGSIKETSRKGSIKETPGKGSIKEAPGKGSTKEAPTKGSIKEAPGKGFIKEAPGTGSIKEVPGKGSITKSPGTGSIKEAPGKGSIKETPGIGSIKETSRKGFIKEAAEKGSNKEALEKGSIKEALEKGSIKESREKGSIKEAPGKGSIKEEPGKGSIKEALGKGSIKETSRKGSIKETPGKGSIKEAPGKGSTKEAPTKGSIKEAPGKGFIKEAPGIGSIKEAPGIGSIKEAPGTGSMKEAPGKGSIKEAPGKGSIKEAPGIGSIKEAPGTGSMKEKQEDHIRKDHTEKQAVLTDLKTNIGDTHTAPKLPQKRQNEGGIVQHARKGQNEHEAVSTSPTRDGFENDPVSQHTHTDENLPGYTPDPWRHDVTGKGTTSSPFQQDQEEMDAAALSLKKNLGKTDGYGKEHSLHRVERENNDPDCRCTECDINSAEKTNFINVAYNKPVTASSRFWERKVCFFVDGISTPTVDCSCMHTADHDITPWVEVDMEAIYTIRKILIVRRQIEDNTHDLDIERMWALQLQVDGQICHTWPPYEDTENLAFWRSENTYDIRCETDVTGQYLRLEKLEQPGYGWRFHIIFCEVTVLVCKPGFYGPDCLPCPADENCTYVCNNLYGCDAFEPWNVALKKTATQSSILKGGPGKAVDGLNVISDPEKCTSTNPAIDGSGDRWWQVDMASPYKVFKLIVHTRVDCCANQLDHFDVFVEDEGMQTLSSPTKKCAEHRNDTLEEASEIELNCDPEKHNRGQFVILVAPSPHLLQFCEVRVFAHDVIEFEAGESCAEQNELKDCHVDHICADTLCKVNAGGDCTGTYSAFCVEGTVCDGGACKLLINQDCTGKESLCRFGAACDPEQARCKWILRQQCPTGDCIAGTQCDLLSKCKLLVGDACADTLDCPAGSQCNLVAGGKKCVCGGSSGLCDSQVGFAGGDCAEGTSKCLALNLECTNGQCVCEHGYTVFSADFTCRVAVNFICSTTPDCNTGLECVSGTCKLLTGERCTQGANECKSLDVCGVDNVCRVKVNKDCSNHPLLCQSGATCNSGLCKLKKGARCAVVRGNECASGTTCTADQHNKDAVKRCRLKPGQSCLGTDRRNCEEDTVCVKDVCKLRLQSDCVGANTALCRSETTCDNSKCKYVLGNNCANTSQCISTGVCDAKDSTCRAKKGVSCKINRQECLSGGTCVPQSGGGSRCQCTVHPNVNQEAAECDPKPNVVGGSCTANSCIDPNAVCDKGICTCVNGRTFEISTYTCGFGPGDDCKNDSTGCNFGTICDRTGACMLTLGQSCFGKRRPFCGTGLVCEEDICKMSLNMDCTDNPDLCMTGTVCGVNENCKLPRGSNCGDTSVCVGGANCEDNKCICIDGISLANGLVCEPLIGKVNGKCTDGTSCEDSHAICNTTVNLCKCEEGFAPEPTTQTCGLATNETCTDNPLSCLVGSTCDPITATCRLQLGQICDKDTDCVTGTICDTDGTCKIAFNGTCSPFGSDCASGTFCDSLKKCRYGKSHVCKVTEECSAGAMCQSAYCVCSRDISSTHGVICEPKSGRIGSDCGVVAVCDASLGGICGPTQKCECPPGKGVLHDFSCEGYAGEGDDPNSNNKDTSKSNLAVILGSFLGALGFLACCACCCFFVAKRNRKDRFDDAPT
ncbi:uncharacterized protein [Littorina saxatilis]|uniref:uncharacterized protein isoform X2 n=1 Tax=Littorina saxatilis TaxID=31220 RepID=UPI0038B44F44